MNDYQRCREYRHSNGDRPAAQERTGKTRLETFTFVFDRVLGKPKQDIGVSGGITHVHTRDERLAAMPKEALEALARAYDDVLARYAWSALPVADVSQDGPQNQIDESQPSKSCRRAEAA